MRFRLLVVAGAVAALSTFTLTANATPGVGGACTTDAGRPAPSGTTQALPDGGMAYAGGSQTSGAAGVQGSHGWLDASGGTASQGGTVSGYQTESGVNGSLTVSSAPGVCAGVGATTVHS